MNKLNFALPTQPLLGNPTAVTGQIQVTSQVRDWMAELALEADVLSRAGSMCAILRKRIGTPELNSILRSIIASAVNGDPDGVAALAGLVAVRAPGETVVERVREFPSVHRVAERHYNRIDNGGSVDSNGRVFLRKLEELDRELDEVFDEALGNVQGLPHPRDIGPARVCRRAMGSLVAELQATGTLSQDNLGYFIRLASLELDAVESRASALAGSINPFSARHVSQVMPILSALDTEVRDMRSFLSTLAEKKRASLFHEQQPAVHDHLDGREHRALLAQVAEDERLAALRQLLLSVERKPRQNRLVGFYADKLIHIGARLHERKLRRNPLNVVEALLLINDFEQDGSLTMPIGDDVRSILLEEPVEGVELDEGRLTVPFDPTAARILPMPMGLPVPLRPEGEEAEAEEATAEESIKDLVLGNINNTSILLGLLKNAKVVGTPGIVAMMVQRCRTMRVLEVICEQRQLHTGYSNKEVPISLLRSSARIPIKTLRKFINVRYVNKIELRRLSVDRSGIRREVADEIERYLKTLA